MRMFVKRRRGQGHHLGRVMHLVHVRVARLINVGPGAGLNLGRYDAREVLGGLHEKVNINTGAVWTPQLRIGKQELLG